MGSSPIRVATAYAEYSVSGVVIFDNYCLAVRSIVKWLIRVAAAYAEYSVSGVVIFDNYCLAVRSIVKLLIRVATASAVTPYRM